MIVITDTELEKNLKQLLQRNLKLWINKRVWREGRLLLFKQSGFYLEFIVNSKKKSKERFEIPIPFGINSMISKNVVYFDYQISTLSGKNEELLRLFKSIKPTGKSKFYDTVVNIEIIPDVIV